MKQVYFFNIRSGELRRAGGAFVATYSSNMPVVALEEIINEGYSFIALTESHIFFSKEVD